APTTYSFDSANRLTGVAHDLNGTTNDVTFGLSYNPANQILARTSTNDTYTGHPANQNISYTANGLNQYSAVAGTSFTYDSRGNLTSDGTRTFTYDIENHLLTETGGTTAATLPYDPIGRLQTSTAGGAATTFLYDGDRLAAEYDGSGNVL